MATSKDIFVVLKDLEHILRKDCERHRKVNRKPAGSPLPKSKGKSPLRSSPKRSPAPKYPRKTAKAKTRRPTKVASPDTDRDIRTLQIYFLRWIRRCANAMESEQVPERHPQVSFSLDELTTSHFNLDETSPIPGDMTRGPFLSDLGENNSFDIHDTPEASGTDLNAM